MPKKISKQERSDIKDAVNSIPSLIIEHVSFSDSSSSMDNENTNEDPRQKYVLSQEKINENRKKRNTIIIGIAIILSILLALWILNIKTFFFDATRTTSKEAQLLKTMKENFDSTVNLVSPPVTTTASSSALSASSTENIENITKTLKDLFTDTDTSSTATSTIETTSTTEMEIASSTVETSTDSTSTATSTQ